MAALSPGAEQLLGTQLLVGDRSPQRTSPGAAAQASKTTPPYPQPQPQAGRISAEAMQRFREHGYLPLHAEPPAGPDFFPGVPRGRAPGAVRGPPPPRRGSFAAAIPPAEGQRQIEVPCPPGAIPGEVVDLRLPDGRKCLVRVPENATGDSFLCQWTPIVEPKTRQVRRRRFDDGVDERFLSARQKRLQLAANAGRRNGAGREKRKWRDADALIATSQSSRVTNFLSPEQFGSRGCGGSSTSPRSAKIPKAVSTTKPAGSPSFDALGDDDVEALDLGGCGASLLSSPELLVVCPPPPAPHPV
eukprot:COSAG04_NODE_1638_length_6094_cov_4.630525_7_plen_301_part_01